MFDPKVINAVNELLCSYGMYFKRITFNPWDDHGRLETYSYVQYV